MYQAILGDIAHPCPPSNCKNKQNDIIPSSESFSSTNTERWSGVAMGERASYYYGSFENYVQLQLGPTVTWRLGFYQSCLRQNWNKISSQIGNPSEVTGNALT